MFKRMNHLVASNGNSIDVRIDVDVERIAVAVDAFRHFLVGGFVEDHLPAEHPGQRLDGLRHGPANARPLIRIDLCRQSVEVVDDPYMVFSRHLVAEHRPDRRGLSVIGVAER